MIEFRTSLQYTEMAKKLPIMERVLRTINPDLKIHNQLLRTRSLIWIPFECTGDYEVFLTALRKEGIAVDVELMTY